MANHPILYSFRRCPYAMRARMAWLISGETCALREVSLRNKPSALIALSPKATVPVLHCVDGTVLDESIHIMEWALERNDPEKWLKSRDDPRIAKNDTWFKFHLDRYKYPDRHGSDPYEHRAQCVSVLTDLEKSLSGRANLAGNARSLVDIALVPFVRQFAMTDRVWFDQQPISNLRNWLSTHLASPLFAHSMIRLPAWQPGGKPVLFGDPR